MKTARNETNWYVQPLNAETNQALAQLLASTNELVECAEIVLADGKACAAFQLNSYEPITKLRGGRTKFGYKYQVYYQRGAHGKIKKWIFQ